jgi:hypothetical protein
VSKFRDAIVDAVANAEGIDPDTQQTFPADAENCADAILAMPEMQAIKQFIVRQANGPSPKMDLGKRQMEIWKVPESVIDWVLS